MQQIQVYRCSVCDNVFSTQRQCQQHCSQPRAACNQGRHSSQFATVVPTQIRFDPRDRVVGGRERTERMRGEGGAEHDIPEVDQGQLQVELDDEDELENEDLAGTP